MSELLNTNKSYRPFIYPSFVEVSKSHEKSHWIETEADLQTDVIDWKQNLSESEKNLIIHVLRLFTQSDVAVGQSYYNVLIPFFKNNEVRSMLGSFAAREFTHQRAYALLNDTLGLPDSEFTSFLEYKEMTDKMDYIKDTGSKTISDVAMFLCKTILTEGVSLFASFVMLLNFQRYGKMLGMCKIVEWSIRDETMHVQGNTKLFRTLCNDYPRIVTDDFKKEIYNTAKNLVKLEDNFIDLAYELGDVTGLKVDEVKKYIRYITDKRLIQFGLKGHFKVKDNPIEWVDWIVNGVDHSNFFESKVTEYDVAGMTGDWSSCY